MRKLSEIKICFLSNLLGSRGQLQNQSPIAYFRLADLRFNLANRERLLSSPRRDFFVTIFRQFSVKRAISHEANRISFFRIESRNLRLYDRDERSTRAYRNQESTAKWIL